MSPEPKTIDLEEVIAGCKRNNRRHQKTLFDHFSGKMFGVCLRYSDSEEEAQDIFQEGMIHVFKKIKDFRGEGSFEGWMRKVMVSRALNYLRKEKKYKMKDPIDDNIGIEDPNGVDGFHNLSVEELLNLLRGLPVGYRTVFNLYEIEGYHHKEIGKKLNISENTSKSQLLKARRALQIKLEQLNREK